MTNLRISSINVMGHCPDGKLDVEISGAWTGNKNPPKVLKNFYRNEEDQLLQDVFHQTEVTRGVNILPIYGLGNRTPIAHTRSAEQCLVSYKLSATTDATPVDIVSDFIFGQDEDEYTTWNLFSRLEK